MITLIARRDSTWARRLTDAALASDSSNANAAGRMEANYSIAYELVRDYPERVPEFAERSLRGGVHPWLAEAVREFNAQTPEALAQTNWRQRVTVERQHREFPLKLKGIEYGFGPSMPKLAAMDMEATLAEVLKLKGEPQQAQGLMALAADMLKSSPVREE